MSRIKDERELLSPMRVFQYVLLLPLLVACNSSDVGAPGGSSSAGSSSAGSGGGAGRTGATYAGQSSEAGASNVGLGGRVGSAGSASGGSGQAGASAGGVSDSGGSAMGGNSGRAGDSGGPAGGGGSGGASGTGVTGGTTGTGGAPSTGGSSGASPGCGSTNTTSACSKSGTKCTLSVGGTNRTFYVELPSGYSPSTPYRVIFQFHPLGSSAEAALTMYSLKSRIPDAIYVTPQGLGSSGSTGWPDTNGQDVNFTKAMVEDVQNKFCVDRSRIFSTGFSYGGIMSLTVGCQMSDVFRAIAPESGQLFAPSCKLSHPVALWQSEGDSDGTVTPTSAASARDYYVKANGCSSTTHAVSPSPCVTYDGCKSGYPVTWCPFRGGHEMPSFGPDAIAAFFKQF